jgi:hypothetical protein
MAGFFKNVHLCDPPTSVGMGEPAGWQDWRCGCGRRWDLEHTSTSGMGAILDAVGSLNNP